MNGLHWYVTAFALAGGLACGGATPSPTPAEPAAPSPTQPGQPAQPGQLGQRWVSGYYAGYQRALYPEASVDFANLTHIFVTRLRPASGGAVVADFDIDAVNGPRMARTLAERAHAAGRKAVLMVGGAGDRGRFVDAASSGNRARFVANLLRQVDELGYDGLDIDWEPIETADRAPLLALLRELRAARPALLLAVPVGFANANFPSEIDPWYAQLAAAVDQLNVMTYEMAGPWDGWVTWHNSALTDHAPNRPSSVASSAELYLRAGVPAAKLGIGLAFYGSCWRGAAEPRQPVRAGVSLVASDNDMGYANIMADYYAAGARRWDAAAQVPYLSFATGRGPRACTLVSYDDEQSIAAKGDYVRDKGLGGAIVWTINQGHLAAAPADRRDPLLKAAYTSIVR